VDQSLLMVVSMKEAKAMRVEDVEWSVVMFKEFSCSVFSVENIFS
jgi:hypothetical protein